MRLLTVLLMILPLAALPDLAEAKQGRDKAKATTTVTRTVPKPAPTQTPAKPRAPLYSGADFDQTLGLGNYFKP